MAIRYPGTPNRMERRRLRASALTAEAAFPHVGECAGAVAGSMQAGANRDKQHDGGRSCAAGEAI
jgi:hypothetical protein